MQVGDTLELVRNTLEAGMTAGVSEHEDYYVKTWRGGSQVRPVSGDFPMAVLMPVGSQIRPFAVGEDVEEIELQIFFYSQGGNMYSENSKALAMVEKSGKLLREDPTLGQEDIDTKVEIRFPVKTSFDGTGNSLSIGEIRCRVRVAVPS